MEEFIVSEGPIYIKFPILGKSKGITLVSLDVIYPNFNEKTNTTYWRNLMGELHRTDGPAVECYGGSKTQIWYFNNKIHRWRGPAVEEWIKGTKFGGILYEIQWWLWGVKYSEEKYWEKIQRMEKLNEGKLYKERKVLHRRSTEKSLSWHSIHGG